MQINKNRVAAVKEGHGNDFYYRLLSVATKGASLNFHRVYSLKIKEPNIMRLSLVFTHCTEKVFHRHSVPPISVEERLSGLNNEVLSRQAVYCLQTRATKPAMSCVINSTGRWRSISACAGAIGAERFSLLSRDRRELPDDRAGLISRSADAAAATAFSPPAAIMAACG